MNINPKELDEYFNKFKELNLLVIGETLIDRYYFGNQMSQFRVECLIEFLSKETKDYLGGAGLVANNASSFVKVVDLVTLTNKDTSYIQNKLNSNVNLIPIVVEDYPIPIKTRYVDKSTGRYYFKSTIINDRQINNETEDKIISNLDLNKYDIIIIIDKGHGMMTDNIINYISGKGRYISVNCQANAENYGYNRVDRYKKVNLVLLNQREIRNLLQNRDDNMYKLINNMRELLEYDRIIVTLGKDGCMISDKRRTMKAKMISNSDTIDPIGAGDAVQVITTLLSYCNVPIDKTAYIGNLAGNLVCKTLGTDTGLKKDSLYDICNRYR